MAHFVIHAAHSGMGETPTANWKMRGRFGSGVRTVCTLKLFLYDADVAG
jgi:hypothetical protein